MTLATLMPADTPEWMAPAWASCMSWAIGNPDMLAAFRAETGNQYRPPANALEAAVDRATGADRAFIEAFIRWANDNVWGRMDEQHEP